MTVYGKKGSMYNQDVLGKDPSLILFPIYVTYVKITLDSRKTIIIFFEHYANAGNFHN